MKDGAQTSFKLSWRFNFQNDEIDRHVYTDTEENALLLEQDLVLNAARMGVEPFLETNITEEITDENVQHITGEA